MTYTEKRRQDRAECKAKLLVALRQAEASGQPVCLRELELPLGRCKSTLQVLWTELAKEGLIDYPTEERLNNGKAPLQPPPDLVERIAAVREAKAAKWDRTRRLALNEAELAEALPCPAPAEPAKETT